MFCVLGHQVVLLTASEGLAILVPFHSESGLGEFTLKDNLNANISDLDVLKLLGEDDGLDCELEK